MFKTTVLVIFGELFFRAHGLQAGFSMFKKIFTTFNLNDFSENILKLGLDKFDFRIIIVTLLIVLIISILKEKGINIREAISKKTNLYSLDFILCFNTIYCYIWGLW